MIKFPHPPTVSHPKIKKKKNQPHHMSMSKSSQQRRPPIFFVLLLLLIPPTIFLPSSSPFRQRCSFLVAAESFKSQCYYAKHKQAGSEFIPCKDPAKYGVSWCCQKGDVCLEDQACWNPTYDITYQLGCTDAEYEDEKQCPKKCGLDVGEYSLVVKRKGQSSLYYSCPPAGRRKLNFPMSGLS